MTSTTIRDVSDDKIAAGPVATGAGIAMSRLIAVELRKAVNTRAGFWLMASIGVISALVVTLMLIFADPADLTFDGLLGVMSQPMVVLLPVIAILSVTSEWSQRTGLVTFTLEPRRLRVVAAKFLSVLVLGLVATLVVVAFAAVGNLLASTFYDAGGAWNASVGNLLEFGLFQLLGMLQGFAFGLLLMNSAAAIVLYFVVPIAWSVLANVVSWLRDNLAEWLSIDVASAPLLSHQMDADAWLRLATSYGVWALVPLLVGLWRLSRVEVK